MFPAHAGRTNRIAGRFVYTVVPAAEDPRFNTSSRPGNEVDGLMALRAISL